MGLHLPVGLDSLPLLLYRSLRGTIPTVDPTVVRVKLFLHLIANTRSVYFIPSHCQFHLYYFRLLLPFEKRNVLYYTSNTPLNILIL